MDQADVGDKGSLLAIIISELLRTKKDAPPYNLLLTSNQGEHIS